MKVTGRVTSVSVGPGVARSRIELEGTSAARVKEMFLTEAPDRFFPTAKSWLRHRTEKGGQALLENPLVPIPVMFTRIDPTSDGAKGEFVGLVNGQAPMRIWDENGKTYIEEVGTEVHPLTPMDLPPYRLLEAVPLFGMFARGMRRATNAVLGTPLAAVHAALVKHDNARAIVKTLNELESRG